MTKHGRSLRPSRQSNRHGRRQRRKAPVDTAEKQHNDIMTDEFGVTPSQGVTTDPIEVLDEEECCLESKSEISTLVEEDASIRGAPEGTPLDQFCTPLSETSTVVEEEDEPSPVLSLRRAGIYRLPNYRPRPIPSHPPPADNALGLDLGPPAFFHPFDDPSQVSSEPPIAEAQEPTRNSNNALRRVDELQYAAPAFMVAPSSLKAPTTSRMMSARWSRPQPDPDVVKAVWEQYTEQWKGLLEPDHSLQPLLTNSRVPWPILDPTNPSVTPDDIQDLLLSSAHSTNMPMKKRIREALRLYHPDRFEKLVIERIEDEKEQDT
ncbi:hypothetical protein FRB90_003512, partial [Tulasnella sp. 427]